MAGEEAGVTVVLGQEHPPEHLQTLMDDFAAGRRKPASENSPAYRNIGIGAQILRSLGVRRMRLLSSPLRFNGLSGFDLGVVEWVPAPKRSVWWLMPVRCAEFAFQK